MNFITARKYKKEVNTLYRRAFPANERAPLSFLHYKAKSGKAVFYAVEDEAQFVGLVYIICHKNLAYVFYLAIEESCRGQGYGSQVLEKVKEMYNDYNVILNIEDPYEENISNRDERIKRLHFYEKNGFYDLHTKTKEFDVSYELLGTVPSVTQGEYLELMKDFLGRFVYKIIFRKTIVEE